jgi:ferredoxin
MSDDGQKKEPEYLGQMIPVHVELRSAQVVLSQPEMHELLEEADVIALGDCGCRKEAHVCEHPLDVCLAIDEEARDEITNHAWREISPDDALAVLERSHRAGLVHVAYRKPGEPITLICSCCTCGCNPLKRLVGRDYHEAITESAFVARFDPATCAGCGTCVERCPFGAFRSANGAERPEFRASACFGCGLCVSTCPAGVITFVRR